MSIFVLIFLGLIGAMLINDISSSESDDFTSLYSYDDYISTEIEERVGGGIVARSEDLSKFKFQVGIFEQYNNNIRDTGTCGGALIHPEIVLTAAHCVYRAWRIGVFMGTIFKPNNITSPGVIIVNRANITIHKDFNKKEFLDDIAVVFLPYPVNTSTEFIGTIRLASSKLTNCLQGVGWVSGWGRTHDSYMGTSILNFVEVLPVAGELCKFLDYSNLVIEKQLCSGTGGKGGCSGDSGGPYVIKDENDTYLCGIISFGRGTCYDDFFRVQSSVLYYHDNGWICNNTRSLVGCDYNKLE